ncbi:MAG: hypothetical protein WCF95_03590 [bacterium]
MYFGTEFTPSPYFPSTSPFQASNFGTANYVPFVFGKPYGDLNQTGSPFNAFAQQSIGNNSQIANLDSKIQYYSAQYQRAEKKGIAAEAKYNESPSAELKQYIEENQKYMAEIAKILQETRLNFSQMAQYGQVFKA